MAEAFYTSISITNYNPFVPHYKPSKPFFPLPILSSHYPIHTERTRKRRKSLYLTCLCMPSSPDVDVISTHEHSDGSLMFRFGDPDEVVKSDQLDETDLKLKTDEVVKSDQLDETNLEGEEKESEDNEELNVVKVLDVDHKREVTVKEIDVKSGDSIDVVDEAYALGVDIESDNVVETERSSSQTVSSTSIKMAVPTSASNIELNDCSESGIELEDVFHCKETEELNRASGSVIEVEDVAHEEKIVVEKDGDDSSNALDSSTLDHVSSLEDNAVESLEPITDSNSVQSVSVKLDLESELPYKDVEQETSESNVEIEESSITGNSQNVEIGMQNKVIEDAGEIDIIENTPPSPSLESEPTLDEEADSDTTQASGETDRIIQTSTANCHIFENRVTHNEKVDNSLEILEMESTEESAESGETREIMDASSNNIIESKSHGSILQSEGIPMAKLFLSTGAAFLPHPQKALTGGEDAYFTHESWLGVADGIGLWSLEGINTGVFARELMENCHKIVSDCNNVSITDPEEVLTLAVARAQSPGSSTALVAHFDGQAFRVANIGDSGFIILRDGVVCQRSSPMLHEFNFPVQIERGDEPCKLFEGYICDLVEGDVIVTATDGLFDNLYEQEIVSIISKSLEAHKNPEEIAEILAMRSQEVGSSTASRSPFADAAQTAGYVKYTGGKLDDVAVIVSLVEEGSNSDP